MVNNSKPKVVVGLSGGVDSAVSAYLLQKQGYEVIGLFMNNWDSVMNQENNYKNNGDICDWKKDYDDAKAVAKFLDIPFYHVEFIKEYWSDVFTYFIDEYKKNRTPNPDVLCNKNIKFESFKKYAFKNFDCDYIATGHYARVKNENGITKLMLSKDENKDQTYFLCSLSEEQLKKVIFPLADLTKDEVREIAKRINLPNAIKKDSTGICFIGERNFTNFLKNYIPNSEGEIIDITNNKVLGKHIGTMYYTLGQRKGLSIGGQIEKYFVCKKDLKNRIIYVAPNSLENEYLVSNYIEINDFNWINKQPGIVNWKNIYARFRHRQKLQKVNIYFENNKVLVRYENQKNIAPGQYCVLYKDDICLGGGAIDIVKKI